MWKRFNFRLPLYHHFFKSREVPFINRQVKINDEKYLLRKVTDEDIKALLGIEREVYQGDIPWNRSAFLSELHSHTWHLYLLLEKEEQVAAFVGCRFKNQDGHITNVAVRPEMQGLGLGTFLISEMIKICKRQKCLTMSLEVRKSNMDAQRLYRRLGFVSKAVKKNYYHPDNEDAIDMLLEMGG